MPDTCGSAADDGKCTRERGGSPCIGVILLFVGLGVVSTATVLHISGMATPDWVRYNRFEHYGLFETCIGQEVKSPYDYWEEREICTDFKGDNVTMKQQAAQVLAFLALFAGLTSGVMILALLLKLFLSRRHLARKCIVVPTLVSSIASAIACVCASAVLGIFVDRLYVAKSVKDWYMRGRYDYSFYLCVIAAVLYPLTTVFSLLASKYIIKDVDGTDSNGISSPIEEASTMLGTVEMSDIKVTQETGE